MSIVATDLDIVFYDEIDEVKITKEGSTTTSAAILYDILRKISSNSDLNFDLKSETISLKNDDEVLVTNKWISVDPYMRARMTERKNYKPPFEIGKPMEGTAIGEIIESKSNNFKKGDFVLSEFGWRDNFIANSDSLKKINPINVPIQTYLGPLGFTGHTAYIGLFRIAKIKQNQTILVSGFGVGPLIVAVLGSKGSLPIFICLILMAFRILMIILIKKHIENVEIPKQKKQISFSDGNPNVTSKITKEVILNELNCFLLKSKYFE